MVSVSSRECPLFLNYCVVVVVILWYSVAQGEWGWAVVDGLYFTNISYLLK